MWIEYGIICGADDEAKIVKNVNAFLVKKCGFRKMYKWPDRSIKPVGRPFEIDHYYTQFLKENPGWLFDIRPNHDKVGRVRFADHPECGWTIFTKPFHDTDDDKILADVKAFFSSLLESVGYQILELHRYENGQDRI